jgi:hypothetical protein
MMGKDGEVLEGTFPIVFSTSVAKAVGTRGVAVGDVVEDYRTFRTAHGKPSYADARSYLVLCEPGNQEEAHHLLEAALQSVDEPMLAAIFACLAGRTTPEEVHDLAGEDAEHRCEACNHAGEACLAAGCKAEACHWFDACVRTEVAYDLDALRLTPVNESDLAQWRLRTLLPGTDAG